MRERKCQTCDGTGTILSHRSWFTVDGFRRSKCGICGGTGVSAYRDDPHYINFQQRARALVAEWGALTPAGRQALARSK